MSQTPPGDWFREQQAVKMTCTLGPRPCEGRRCMAWQPHPRQPQFGRCVHVHAAKAQAVAAERVANQGVGALRSIAVDLQSVAMAAQTLTALEPGSTLLELLRLRGSQQGAPMTPEAVDAPPSAEVKEVTELRRVWRRGDRVKVEFRGKSFDGELNYRLPDGRWVVRARLNQSRAMMLKMSEAQLVGRAPAEVSVNDPGPRYRSIASRRRTRRGR